MSRLNIEPHVIVFHDAIKYLFYDTLTYQHLIIPKKDTRNVIDRILTNPLYHSWTELSDEEEHLPFIQQLREHFMADLLLSQPATYPFAYLSKPVFQGEKILKEDSRYIQANSFINIHEVTFLTDTRCPDRCGHCNLFSKQIRCNHCVECEQELSLTLLDKVIKELKACPNLLTLHFKGGHLSERNDIFRYILDHPDGWGPKCVFHFLLEQFLETPGIWPILEKQKLRIKILPATIEKKELEASLKSICKNLSQVTFEFMVCSEYQYEQALKHQQYPSTIIPLYTGDNLSFFEDYVFVDAEDILTEKHEMRNIHGKQFINYHYFGKILIGPDSSIYDYTLQYLGNVNQGDKLAYATGNLLQENSSWLKIRNQIPCKNCLFQWLCPSPSEYEEITGKPDLCHVN